MNTYCKYSYTCLFQDAFFYSSLWNTTNCIETCLESLQINLKNASGRDSENRFLRLSPMKGSAFAQSSTSEFVMELDKAP